MSETLLFLAMLCVAAPAHAYIGPGAGITLLGSLFSLFGMLLVGIVATLSWPVWVLHKRWKRRKNKPVSPPGRSDTPQ